MKKSFAIFIIVSLMLGSFLSVHPDKNGRMSYNSYSLEKEILYLLREEQFELLGNEGSVLDSNKIIYDVNNKEYRIIILPPSFITLLKVYSLLLTS